MLAPACEADLAGMVRDACAAGEPLCVQGAGTKMGMLRPVQAANTLSTRRLVGVPLYAPKELVVSAAAGTTVVSLEAMLAEQGQHLIGEPPDYAALLGTAPGTQTIGGIVATNLSGPRRIASGAVRDHVLGLRFVDGTGAMTRAGGRVLKNVTGLDMCKLLTGSHGTLGVITEVTLKVLPAPEATGSLVLKGLDAPRGVAALSAALGSAFGVSGAAYLPGEAAARIGHGGAVAVVRIEEFAASVAYRLDRLRALLAPFGDAHLLDDAASRAAWASIRDAAVLSAEPADMVWRVSVRPSRGPDILAAAVACGAHGYLDWGGGLALLAGPATEAAHHAISTSVARAGGVWTMLRAPAPMRAVMQEGEALRRIAGRVKSVLDPGGVLNPGRI